MGSADSSSSRLTAEQLQHLRAVTEKVSAQLQATTAACLEVLRPGFVPHRILGRYIEHAANQSVAGADRAWANLLAAYRKVAAKLSGLPASLESSLPPIDTVLELYPWEYSLSSPATGGTITIHCPTKWVLSFASGFTLSQFRQAVAAGGSPLPPQALQFVVRALVMAQMVRSIPRLDELFQLLRLNVREEELPDRGSLPVVTVSSAVHSQLPAEDVVVSATRLTGVSRFTELIDPETIRSLHDPIREKLEALLR